MFKGTSYYQFNEQFKTDDDCYKYLEMLKWGNKPFSCLKCEHSTYCKGRTQYMRKCVKCKYEESITVNTIFEKLKFSMHKAFHIMFRLSVSTKGMSSSELSREFELNQKTCWAFKRKIQHAMRSSLSYPLQGNVEVDELTIGGKEKRKPGRSNGEKRKVIIGVETRKGKIGRLYFSITTDYSSQSLRLFFNRHISKNAIIKTDEWRSYTPLKDSFNIEQIKSQKGKSFPELHVQIMNLKNWLRGIHHKCKDFHLQAYLDEYCFRFNRRQRKESIFNILVERMIKEMPFPYKKFKLGVLSG
jgi:transposase-like protein